MKNVALVFPGQGAQKVGMGRELYDQDPASRAVFDRAAALMGGAFLDTLFHGPEEALMQTSVCQPAIVTMSLAAFAAVQASGRLSGTRVCFAAGLSLGEYSAMAAAGVLSLEETLKLLRRRGELMEAAAKAQPGRMAAVIGMAPETVAASCVQAGCEVANYNAPDQIVITGRAEAVDKACALLAAAGGKKIIPLDVAGAFHSSLMSSAAEAFVGAVAVAPLVLTDVRVVSNVTARPQESVAEIRANLPRQICSSVRWSETVTFLASQGVSDLVEIGPGRVLKGLVRKIDPALNVQNVQAPADIAALVF